MNKAGNQSTTGNAATATKLQTARTINGVKFDGSANISIPTITSRGRVTALTDTTQGAATGLQMYEAYNNSYPTAYGNVLHMKGASAAGEGELLIGWSGTSGAHAPVFIRSRRDHTDAAWSAWAQVYTSRDSIPGVNATGNQNTTGNAATATKLQTARTIGGVSFDGTANINLPGVNVAGNQNTSGNAATATKLQTARTINGVLFDGSKNIELTPRSISKVVHHQGRAYANLNGVVAVNLNDENASALWHELGHHLEYSNPGLLEKARSFLKANVEGDKPSFVNIGGRGKPEWCFRSRLSNIYMAKVYPPASVSNTGKIRQKSPTISKTSATEVFSMALQLYHDKEAAAASLMNGDGLLELLLGVAKELNNAD